MRFWRTLRWAPWWRGPLLLLRRPGVALALAVAAAVAALPVAALPAFLTSAGGATLHTRTDKACQWNLGSHLEWQQWFGGKDGSGASNGGGAVTERIDQEARAAAKIAGLGDPTVTYFTEGSKFHVGEVTATATVASRDGFTDHIEVLSGPSGQGLWVPHEMAEELGIQVGDRITISAQRARTFLQISADGATEVGTVPVEAPVAAIYRDLRREAVTPYWCSSFWLFEGRPNRGPNEPVFPLVLMDGELLFDLADRHLAHVGVYLERPIADPEELTLPAATKLATEIEQLHATLRKQFAVPPDSFPNASPTFYFPRRPDTGMTSQLVGFAKRSVVVQDSLRTTITPISAAGLIVGLAVVVAAGVFWVRRRRPELTVLAIRGVTGGQLGVKAMLEALPALAAGTVGGWALARVLVDRFGPSGLINTEARTQAVQLSLLSLLVVTALIGLTAALACHALVGAPPHVDRRFRPAAWPWEVLLLVAAGLVWLLGDSEPVARFEDGLGEVALLPLRLLLVPILILAGVAMLAGRLIHWVLSRSRNRQVMTEGRVVRHLIRRRLQHAAAAAAVLGVITALPIGLAVFSSTVTGSVQATLAAEARVFVGADVVATLTEPTELPESLRDQATPVVRIEGIIIGGSSYSALLIDPETFARDAAWDSRINGESMQETVDRLSAAKGDAVVPVVAMGSIGGTHVIELVDGQPIEVQVKSVNWLPAALGGYPVLLIDRAVLGSSAAPEWATNQWWIRGQPDQVRELLQASGAPVGRIAVADNLYGGTFFEPITYTFDYLAALSLLAGLVTTVGFLLYLESRLPTLRRGFTMLSRMGLGRRQHLMVLAAELGTPLIVGLSVGIGVTAAAIAVLSSYFEINRKVAPDTVLEVPGILLGGLVAAVAVTTVVAVGFAQAHVRRARAGEVLRDAG